MSVSTPSREDFAALLEESFAKTDLAEGYVAKGIITAIAALAQGHSRVEPTTGTPVPEPFAPTWPALWQLLVKDL